MEITTEMTMDIEKEKKMKVETEKEKVKKVKKPTKPKISLRPTVDYVVVVNGQLCCHYRYVLLIYDNICRCNDTYDNLYGDRTCQTKESLTGSISIEIII